MSVITSRSTILSILKAPVGNRRPSLHKVRFKVPSDVRKIFMDFKTGSNNKEYENLLCLLRDSEISDTDLYKLLSEAKNCISILNYDMRLFIQALILLKWAHRSDDVVRCYQEFINDLVSAHSQHTKVVIDQLVKLFMNTEESDWNDWEPTEDIVKQYNNIHFILKSVLYTIPMSDEVLIHAIKHNFPYLKITPHKQVSYLYNVLKVIKFHPHLRKELLEVVIDKQIAMDVHSPREEIIRFEEEADTTMFEMEVDDVEKSKKMKMKHPIADTFDVKMGLMFSFVKDECFENEKLVSIKCQQLYKDLLEIFERLVLRTHACHHVQFLLFYICSFDKNLMQDFIKFLWRKVTSPSVPPVIRQTSVAYLSSYLARAEYIPLSYLKLYLSKMAEWVHSYISNHDGAHTYTDIKQHSVFYSICQAVFYLIAFRHQDLMDSNKKLVFLQSLNLSKMVTCKLNPLKVCLPTVIDNFAAVTRACQLAYCYTIIENNSRNVLPLQTENGMLINPVIDMYFAFDPYVLIRTSIFIAPLYKEYKSVIEESVKESEKRKRLTSFAEEDDFIGDMTVGSDPMKSNLISELQN